jgi:hypothetical protein
MLSSIIIHIPASYFAACLFLTLCVGLVAGVLISAPFNKNQEHNETDYPDYRH